MKRLFILVIIASILTVFTRCNKFNDINSNPDATTEANATMIATGIILKNFRFSGRDAMAYISENGTAKYVGYANQSMMSSQYGYLGSTSFSGMTVLPNIQQLEKYATGIPSENSFKGLAKFQRAFMFYDLTMKVGDIPYSQAGKGKSELVLNVPYDKQEDVFIGILNELKEADQFFSKGTAFSGDPTPYAGNPDKWRRAVNAFRLKVLLSLSKKVGKTKIDIKKEFNDVYQQAVLLESGTGYLGLNYSSNNLHPLYSTNNVITSRVILSSLLINQLKVYQDRRLFYYAEPAVSQIQAGKTATDPDAYIGVQVEKNYDVITAEYLAGKYSIINNRYQQNSSSDPRILISYAEQQFILAEARILGWITASTAKEFYESGTKAALLQIMATTSSYAHGMAIDQNYINNYFVGEAAFKSSSADQLIQIWWQRYFLNYMQNPLGAYYEYRRTGFPVFPNDPATSLNENKKEAIPLRWEYPGNEITQNQDFLNEALKRQYSGVDDVNAKMWLLQ